MNTPRGQPSKRERRRFQWSLRLLLFFTALCAIGVRLWLVPYWREASTARWLAAIDARVTITVSGPKWLRAITGNRYLERIVSLDFRHCDIQDGDLSRLAWLSRLKSINCDRTPLGDRGLEHLGRVSSLCDLDLEGTSVSDAGLRNVEGLPHLRELRLRRTQVSLRRLEELTLKRPELLVDLAIGDKVYRSTSDALQSREMPIHELLFRCNANEEWSVLWARSQGASGDAAARAAKQQRARWLEEFLTRMKERGSLKAARSNSVGIATLEAALAETQIALARLDHDAEAVSSAQRLGSKAAKRLLELLADELEDSLDEPFSFDCVRDLATRLLLCEAEGAGEADRRLVILSGAVADHRKLFDRISVLYWSGEIGGEAERFASAAIDLALAEAALAENAGDFAVREAILAAAIPQAKLLRQAADAKNQVGAFDRGDMVLAHRRALLLELAWAQAADDPGAEQEAWRTWRSMLADRHHTGNRDFMGNIDLMHPEHNEGLIWMLHVIEQVRERGARVLDGPVADLEKPLSQPL